MRTPLKMRTSFIVRTFNLGCPIWNRLLGFNLAFFGIARDLWLGSKKIKQNSAMEGGVSPFIKHSVSLFVPLSLTPRRAQTSFLPSWTQIPRFSSHFPQWCPSMVFFFSTTNGFELSASIDNQYKFVSEYNPSLGRTRCSTRGFSKWIYDGVFS